MTGPMNKMKQEKIKVKLKQNHGQKDITCKLLLYLYLLTPIL